MTSVELYGEQAIEQFLNQATRPGYPSRQVFWHVCRKGVWHAAHRQAMAALSCRVYAPLSKAHARAMLQQRRLGPARLRLLPKAAGG